MANNSVITLEEPMPDLGLADWNGLITKLWSAADARRQEALDLRHSPRTLRNETRVQADSNTYHTNTALSDPVGDLNRWRATVAAILERIEKEMTLLREEKAATERELEARVAHVLLLSECFTERDGHLGTEIELTYDECVPELKRELCVIEDNSRLLRDQCQVAWDKLKRLEEVQLKLILEAEKTDFSQLDLSTEPAHITFKPDALRMQNKSRTYEAWFEHTKRMKHIAEIELADSYAIRDSLFICREKTKKVLKAQQDRTEDALRKRIFEIQRVSNELHWHKIKMKDRMERCICEIKTLEEALRDKTDALKLAENRLENCAEREGMELCLDEPYEKLRSEVMQLRRIREKLSDKIDCAKTNYTALENHALKTDSDLSNKQHALMIDIRGLDMRAKLKTGQFVEYKGASEETNRNIKLTKMEDEISHT